MNENILISINISLKFVPNGPINNIPALVQVMVWRRPGDNPLSEPTMVNLLTHICVTRPQCNERNENKSSQMPAVTMANQLVMWLVKQHPRHWKRKIAVTGRTGAVNYLFNDAEMVENVVNSLGVFHINMWHNTILSRSLTHCATQSVPVIRSSSCLFCRAFGVLTFRWRCCPLQCWASRGFQIAGNWTVYSAACWC